LVISCRTGMSGKERLMTRVLPDGSRVKGNKKDSAALSISFKKKETLRRGTIGTRGAVEV